MRRSELDMFTAISSLPVSFVAFIIAVMSITLTLAGGQTFQPMRLLTFQVGWVQSSGRLYRTTDNGAHWKDISPRKELLADAFFLDTSHGWALLSSTNENSGVISFKIARTNDSGRNWSVSTVRLQSHAAEEVDGATGLDFVDPLNGWMLLHARSSSAFSWGVLLATDDGGKSWKELPQVPVAARPVFVTAQEGWLSGAGWAGVYHTLDGGKSWIDAGPSLEGLPVSLSTHAIYGDVEFTDMKHGFLPVWLSPQTDAENPRGTALALYFTEDAGRTWKRGPTLTDRSFAKSGAPLRHFGPSSLIRDVSGMPVLVAATTNDLAHPDRLTLIFAHAGGIASALSENGLRGRGSITHLSFTSKTSGWAYTSSNRLLSTNDGGATWRDITPQRTESLSNPN